MGQSSSWYFERLFDRGTSPGTKLAFTVKFFCSSIPSLESLILSDGDPRKSSIARVGTPWWVGNKDGEPLYMATWMPLCLLLICLNRKRGKMKVTLKTKLKFLTIGPGLLF